MQRPARLVACAALTAALFLALPPAPAAAFSVADPGFAVSTYATVAGASGLAFDSLGTLHTSPSGGLAYVGTRLYAVNRAAKEVRELDGTGAPVRVVTNAMTLDCPDQLAASGADLYVTSCGGVYRIRAVNTAPAVEFFSNPGSSVIATHGITISPDGIVFATAGANIWKVGRVTDAAPTSGATLTNVTSAAGLAALAPPNLAGVATFRYLLITRSDGIVQVFDNLDVIAAHAIVNGGSGGGASVIGPDGCLYVTQTSEIARISDAHVPVGCDLAGALGATPSIGLSGGASRPHVGASLVTFTAALANAPAGTLVTFTVSGPNAQTSAPILMDPLTKRATFSYTGTATGTDTVIASATVGGRTVTSNPISVTWFPPLDTTPPTITFTVSGTGAHVLCPGATLTTDPLAVYCGWYDAAPSVLWTVLAGPSGIGSTTGCDPYTLSTNSPSTGTPVTCTATNGDGYSTHRTVQLQALITPPLITATATSGGQPYVAGTPTRQPVTVTFSCDHQAGPWAIASCPTTPITIASGDGIPVSVSGTAVDLSGKTATASFDGIVVDTTGPRIDVQATQPSGSYVFDTWTRGPVTLTFSCSDPGGVRTCPAKQIITSSTATVTVSATDPLGNVSTQSFGPIKIDTTAPVTTATVTGTPAGGGAFAVSATVSLSATDAQSGVASISYAIDAASPVTVSGADAAFIVTGAGSHDVTFFATDAVGNVEPTQRTSLLIVDRLPTTLAITSSPLQIGGGRVSALLQTTTGAAVSGETVRFSAGGVTTSALTDATGVATADLGLAAGTYTLTATYDGSARYFPSPVASQSLTLAARTRFVVWGPSAVGGARVQFYGPGWSKQIADKNVRHALEDFKGLADSVSGATWVARDESERARPSLRQPQYVGVIVTTQIRRTGGGDQVQGNIAGYAVLRVDPTASGGDDDRSRRGEGARLFGTVVGFAAAP